MRLYVVAALVAVLVAGGVWLFVQGGQDERARQDRNTIKTQERVNEALADCAGRHWSERLLNDCD